MPVEEHLHRLLLELLRVRAASFNRLSLLGLRHETVLPLPCKIRSWTVHKKPSTSNFSITSIVELPIPITLGNESAKARHAAQHPHSYCFVHRFRSPSGAGSAGADAGCGTGAGISSARRGR